MLLDERFFVEMTSSRRWRFGSIAVAGLTSLVLSAFTLRAEDPAPKGADAKPANAGSRAGTLSSAGGTRHAERAVVDALQWLARHQNADGSWTQDGFRKHCSDKSCTGAGAIKDDVGTTSLGILPFLAAGQTQKAKGQYQKNVEKSLTWLVRQQKADGDLRGGTTMYAHGLATLVLSQAYAMTGDKELGTAAQKAVDFIQTAQHKTNGGWRYQPGMEGDTSVFGWQISAIRAAQVAGLNVSDDCLANARKYLKSAAVGDNGERFKYMPTNPQATPSMTAVGLLGSRYLGAKPDEPRMTAGVKYLLEHSPDLRARNCYYWYYGAQVLHAPWDVWNRQARKVLVDSQVRDGCAKGSWDPMKPVPDMWGPVGGRITVTSLSVLSLEVTYGGHLMPGIIH
jgi:hypothetical protein